MKSRGTASGTDKARRRELLRARHRWWENRSVRGSNETRLPRSPAGQAVAAPVAAVPVLWRASHKETMSAQPITFTALAQYDEAVTAILPADEAAAPLPRRWRPDEYRSPAGPLRLHHHALRPQ